MSVTTGQDKWYRWECITRYPRFPVRFSCTSAGKTQPKETDPPSKDDQGDPLLSAGMKPITEAAPKLGNYFNGPTGQQ